MCVSEPQDTCSRVWITVIFLIPKCPEWKPYKCPSTAETVHTLWHIHPVEYRNKQNVEPYECNADQKKYTHCTIPFILAVKDSKTALQCLGMLRFKE